MAIEFNDQPNLANIKQPRQNKGLAGKLIKWGWADDLKGANKILTITAIAFFLLSLVFWFI